MRLLCSKKGCKKHLYIGVGKERVDSHHEEGRQHTTAVPFSEGDARLGSIGNYLNLDTSCQIEKR